MYSRGHCACRLTNPDSKRKKARKRKHVVYRLISSSCLFSSQTAFITGSEMGRERELTHRMH